MPIIVIMNARYLLMSTLLFSAIFMPSAEDASPECSPIAAPGD
jgi:hypothetical protein